eukprot:3939106-Rhodomonas_salina.3
MRSSDQSVKPLSAVLFTVLGQSSSIVALFGAAYSSSSQTFRLSRTQFTRSSLLCSVAFAALAGSQHYRADEKSCLWRETRLHGDTRTEVLQWSLARG